MAGTQTDRGSGSVASNAVDVLSGLSSSAAIKTPCRVATTANITLSGEQTIDGIAVVANDRVLVKDQSDATDNGIWICSASAWSRAVDFFSNNGVASGTLVAVSVGTVNAGVLFAVTTDDPVTIGTSSITFSLANAAVWTVAATGKTTPVDADLFAIFDSAASNALKKLTWANIKATLKTYFDTLYLSIADAPDYASETHGQHTIWVPASAMTPLTTNGAESGSLETSTYKNMMPYLAFDPSTNEFAQFLIQMPKSWDEGTIVAQFIWSHPATTTNFGVQWAFKGVAFGDGDAYDSDHGSAQLATDTGGTTEDIYISAETSAITIGGSPGAEELVNFEVSRYAVGGSDTLAVDAYLIGVKIHYTTDASTDD